MFFPASRRLETVIHRMLMRRLLLPVLAAVLLVDVVAGVLIWRSILQRQDALVGALANRARLVLQAGEQPFMAAARLGGGQEALIFLKEAVPQFRYVYHTDAQSRLVGLAPLDERYLGQDFSNQGFMHVVLLSGQIAYTAPLTSPLTGQSSIYLVTALADGGRLSAELRLDALNAVLTSSLLGEQEAAGLGLYDANKNRIGSSGQLWADPLSFPALGQHQPRLINGQPVLVSQARLEPVGWTVTVETPLLTRLRGYILGILGALLLVPVLSAVLTMRFGRALNRSVVRPLAMLNERTRQLAEGDFSSWISFDTLNTSITEVAELAGSFQRMQQAVLQRQAALQVSEARFREMAELLPDIIIELDAARRMRYANRAAQDLLGDFEPGKLFDRVLARDEAANLIDICRLAANGASLHPQVLRFVRPNGVTFPGELVLTALRGRDSSLLGYRGVVRDITDRLAFEETLRRSYQLFTEGPVVVFRVRASGDHPVEYVSPNIAQYGYRPHDFISRRDFFQQIIFPNDSQRVSRAVQGHLESGARFYEQEYRLICGNGDVRWVYDFTSVNRDAAGQPTHFDWYILDITERKHVEERIGVQLQRLAGLQLVDASITANADLSLTLQLLIAQLIELLDVNAAVVLRYDAGTQMLGYAAGKGFVHMDPSEIRLEMGESYAGKAAARRERVILNLSPSELAGGFKYAELEQEHFVTYCALPLVAKGEVKGVLEIFNRKALDYDREWMDFLETLAGQAAIAIYNADLLEHLQRSNEELRQAYEATIRGLSRALELRDKETEGHSQRVSELAVALARKAGLAEDQLEFVRIGALLHDIGKLGVPDQILHKEGTLSEDEWVIMRRHPENARRMLSTIDYLRPALAIPQYHHERWDGSGYPYGLRGEEIPIAARIFAVVDVWDALSFDRPYRLAWNTAKVREYLVLESGRQFDPRLVDLFLQIMDQEAVVQANLLDTNQPSG